MVGGNRLLIDWRGRDCDDTSKIIHPHRVDSDRILDHNCNGVYGVSSSSQVALSVFVFVSLFLLLPMKEMYPKSLVRHLCPLFFSYF